MVCPHGTAISNFQSQEIPVCEIESVAQPIPTSLGKHLGINGSGSNSGRRAEERTKRKEGMIADRVLSINL